MTPRPLVLAAIAAAAVPLLPRDAPAQAPPVRWPATWEGRRLTPLPPAAVDARIARGFPGRIARFSDGRRQVVLRHVPAATRRLHPARDCFGALGYRIAPLPMRPAGDGYASCFEARRRDGRLRVCERIVDRAGGGFPDASSWYWPALLGRSPGPWIAATVVERVGA